MNKSVKPLLKRPASRWQTVLTLFLIAGITLTAISLLATRDGRQFYCSNTNPGPLDELSARHQQERGLPFAYYSDDISNTCFLPANTTVDKHDAQYVLNAIADIVIWGLVVVAIGEVYRSRKKSNSVAIDDVSSKSSHLNKMGKK